MRNSRIAAVFAILAAFVPLSSLAQAQPAAPAAPAGPAAQGAAVIATMTAKVTAIDQSNRVVTLQDAQGNVQTIQVGPDVTRFDNLKVGDTVTFRYVEAVEYGIAKPGSAPMAQGTPTVTRAPGEKPGGAISHTVTALVTITAIDLSVPSVTVKTQDGKTITMEINDKASVAGYKAGDTVQITYTQALIVTVQ